MAASDKKLAGLLTGAKTIAVVGASPNPSRPSNTVMRYLLEQGYEVYPVRPRVKTVLGRQCFGSLEELPAAIDIVDVFRKAEACPEIARSAVAIGARSLWLQQGIVSTEAADIARGAGMEVVMDSCIKVVHQELGL